MIERGFNEQEQQSVAVGTGNVHFMSNRQMSSDAATMWRCCGLPLRCGGRAAPVAAAVVDTADAAVYTVCTPCPEKNEPIVFEA